MSEKTLLKTKKVAIKKFFACFFIALIVLVGITAGVNALCLKINIKKAHSFPNAECKQLSVENISNDSWNIYSDEGLKLLQLTDIHLGGGWMSFKKDQMALNAVAAMINAEKPDFVIVTGDITYSIPLWSGTLNNRSGAKLFAELMETLGVCWTASYGNHDVESYSYFSREDLSEFYSGYPHCLVRDGAENVDGSANQVFNLVSSDGIIIRSLFTVDSHSFVDGDFLGFLWKYDNIHENQIAWYADTVKENNSRNELLLSRLDAQSAEKYKRLSDGVPSSVFTHLPLSEYRTAWFEYVNNGAQDTENVKYYYGAAGETDITVYSGVYEDNFFETMLSLESTDSVFCGHDHKNNFSLSYKGIRLSYSYCIDYLAYFGIHKLGAQRGCTVIDIFENGLIDFSFQNYYQDKYISFYPKEEVTIQELR